MKGLTASSVRTRGGVRLTAKNVDVKLHVLGLIHQLRTGSRNEKPQKCGFFVWWRWGESVTCLLFVTRLIFFFLLHSVITVFARNKQKHSTPPPSLRSVRHSPPSFTNKNSHKTKGLVAVFMVEMGGVEPPC